MISLNIEREMKLKLIDQFLLEAHEYDENVRALVLLNRLEDFEITAKDAWEAEERMREAELTAIYSREAC